MRAPVRCGRAHESNEKQLRLEAGGEAGAERELALAAVSFEGFVGAVVIHPYTGGGILGEGVGIGGAGTVVEPFLGSGNVGVVTVCVANERGQIDSGDLVQFNGVPAGSFQRELLKVEIVEHVSGRAERCIEAETAVDFERGGVAVEEVVLTVRVRVPGEADVRADSLAEAETVTRIEVDFGGIFTLDRNTYSDSHAKVELIDSS